ncbi:MAG: hypothetical protein U0794_13605 [Isosphaeraceae bacterium]
MKRALTLAVILGVSSCFGLTGCSDESKVSHQETVKTPEGTTTTTVEKRIESSGENPPTNSAGEKASTSGTDSTTSPTTPPGAPK